MHDYQQSPLERARQLLNEGPTAHQSDDHQQQPVASSTMTGSANHEPGVASDDPTDWSVDDPDVTTEFTQEQFDAMSEFDYPKTGGAGIVNPGFRESTTDFFNAAPLESVAGALGPQPVVAESSAPVPDDFKSISVVQPEMDTTVSAPKASISSPAAPSSPLTPMAPTDSRGTTPSDYTPRATPEFITGGVDPIEDYEVISPIGPILRRCLACKKQKRRCTGGVPCDLCTRRGKTADACKEDVDYNRRQLADLRRTAAHETVRNRLMAGVYDKGSPASGSKKARSRGGAAGTAEAAAPRLRTLAPAPAPATFMSAAPAAQVTYNNTSAPATLTATKMSADAPPATENASMPAMPSPDSSPPPHTPAPGSGSGSWFTTPLPSATRNSATMSSLTPGDAAAISAPTHAIVSASAEPVAQKIPPGAGTDAKSSNDNASTAPEGTPQPPSMLPPQSPDPTSASASNAQKSAPKKRAATPKKASGEKKATATPKEKKTPAPKEKKTPTPRKRATKADQPKTAAGATPIKGSGLRNEILPSDSSDNGSSPRKTPSAHDGAASRSSELAPQPAALPHGLPSAPVPHPDADYVDVSNLLDPTAFASHMREPAGAFSRSLYAASAAETSNLERFLEASRQAFASNSALMPAGDRAKLAASANPTLAAIFAPGPGSGPAPRSDDEQAAAAPQHSPRSANAEPAVPSAPSSRRNRNEDVAAARDPTDRGDPVHQNLGLHHLPARPASSSGIPSTSVVAAKRRRGPSDGPPSPCPEPKRLRSGATEPPIAAALLPDTENAQRQQEVPRPGLALSVAEWKAVVAYAPGVDGSTYARLTKYEAVLAEAERYHVWYVQTFVTEPAYNVPSPGHNWARLRLDLPMPAMWNVVLRPQPDWPEGTRVRLE